MDLDRRAFLTGLGGSAIVAATLALSRSSFAARTDSAEALAAELLRGLSDQQRAEIAFPWEFTWHFRGAPHVHVWAHVASSPDVPFNSVRIEA